MWYAGAKRVLAVRISLELLNKDTYLKNSLYILDEFSVPKHSIPVSRVATIPSITHSQVFLQRISPHLAALLVPFLQTHTLNIEDLGRSQFGILGSPLMLALFLPFIPLALEGLSEVMK